jgi:hypothetical protein
VAPVKYLPEAQYSWQVTVEREKLIGILVFLCSLNSALIWSKIVRMLQTKSAILISLIATFLSNLNFMLWIFIKFCYKEGLFEGYFGSIYKAIFSHYVYSIGYFSYIM